VLHNNAGVSMTSTLIEDVDEAVFDHVMAINVRSVYLGARYVVPRMKQQRAGVIINTASTAGVRPRAAASAYAASKGAVVALTKALAVELAPFGIRAVCLLPFATDTRCFERRPAPPWRSTVVGCFSRPYSHENSPRWRLRQCWDAGHPVFAYRARIARARRAATTPC
jgi:NAD(P)-dependent dehydrogenase (short-subunit alcohol dehydrogenase family)